MYGKTNRSAYANFLRAKMEMYRGDIEVTSYPYSLNVDPCDICQLRCPTCPTGIEAESRKGRTAEEIIYRGERSMLTPDVFNRLMDELGEYLFLILFYNYGEPLLNKSVPAFIRTASQLGIETECHSNLSLPLSDAFIEELLTSGLDHLYGSIDGFTQPIYEIHRVGGHVELVKNNLRRLAAARERLGVSTTISYNFLVFSFNEHEVPEARAFSNEIGIEFIARDAFVHLPAWLPSYRQGEKPFVVAEEIAPPPEFSYRIDDQILSWNPLPVLDESKLASRCGWHYGYSVLQPRGEVAPCCALAKEAHDFGTMMPGARGFAEVWNNDVVKTARARFAGAEHQNWEKESICTRCPLPKFIQHLFSARDAKVIEQFYGVYGAADPVLKQAFDLMLAERWHGNPSGIGNERNTLEFVKYVDENIPPIIDAHSGMEHVTR